ncbi:hypothetical protein EDB92DRAFT_1801783 [Lactarius akahatsu]|uniref:Meiotically up-regulated protein Msb1/Mug8 domain-containing protein n=1 Tax=Lactarius akahatsu TaxID=416441 RepID=A0AAD4LCG3_9AGAM|nr:hypothetical protein EDB92DRAFT_1801783 [Lactarius akahatsu]
MPSFLSKLLGRKKVQEPEPSTDKRGSPTSLLEGKFEAVSPTVSPSAALFTDSGAAQIRGNDKAKDKESPFNLLRYKSRPSSDSPTTENPVTDVPHLSLTLPVTKDRGRALDVVFEPGHEAIALLDEAAIGERRLSPDEALSLVRACSQVIIERGLETLGIMHPHWHSASLEVQHRLISLYILSLASNSPNSVTSPTSPTSASVESELQYARSPHDVGAVLRWGLRHLKLDGASFGKESGDWTWYSTFAAAERTGSFPSDAFSKSLIPQLPPAHSELLLATLDIISSLAAHGEANGSSGSRLSRFLGLWLLTAEHSPEGDDWATFYDRWDRAGRILEHLFLARIRDEAHKLPRRLTELVEQYPYASDPDASDDSLLVRPRFSTRDYDALFVRLDTEYIGALKPKSHPLRLIADALRAQFAPESATVEDADLWANIRKASLILDTPGGTSDLAYTEPIPNFSNVFSDETIRLLSLIPADVSDKSKHAPTFVLLSPISPGRPRSFSLPESPRDPTQVDHSRAPPPGQPAAAPNPNANPSTAPTTASPETPTDWLQFSSQGFGTISPTRDLVATLWDNDVEVTVPPPAPLSRKSSRRAHSRRSSVDSPSVQTHAPPLPAAPAPPTSKATLIARVKLNEAFVDFWADALLDPISKPWLRFVLCQLKPLPSVVASPTPTPTWLVIEQRFVRHAPVQPPKKEVETPTTPPRPRASSPRPSLRAETSRLSAALSFSPKMRFGFFTGGSSDPKSPKETSPQLPQVGELGEVTKETQDAVVAVDKPKESDAGEKGCVDDGAVASAAATAGAVAVAVAAASAVTAAADQEIPSSPVPEAKIAQPALESVSSISYLAGISEGPIPQPESVPAAETTPSYVEVFAPTALASVAEEPSTPEPSAPVHPTAIRIETPPVAEEPDRFTADPTVTTDASTELPTLVAEPTPTADVAAPAADILAEAPALATEESLPSSQTTVAPATADVTTETSISVPAETEPTRVIEAAPAAETPSETLTPFIDEPKLAPQTDAPIIAEIPVETPTEEPNHVAKETPVDIQAPELSEPASAPETASHAEAPPPITEAPAEPIREERSLVIDDAAETSIETVPPAAEESTPPVPEETTAETVPDVDVAPVADEPAPTLEQSASPVVEIPAPVPEEPAPVPEPPKEEAVPAVVEHSAETTAPVAEGSTITEQTTLATVETPAPAIEESTLTTGSPLEADTPAETPAPVPGEPLPVPEESVPEASPPTLNAEEQQLSQKGSAARSTEEYAPPAEEHLSDQPETVVEEPLQVQVTEQVVQQEPVTHVDGEAPQATEEEPVVQKPESVPGAEIVTAPEVDAPVEAPVSNGTGKTKSFVLP